MSGYTSQVTGEAVGLLLVLNKPLSFWGGLDPTTGLIIDHNHPQVGVSVVDHIVAMPHSRGSSSASSVFAEALRLGKAPAGIVLGEPDPILVIGSLVAAHLYGTECPILIGRSPEPRDGLWSIKQDELIAPARD